MPGLLLSIILAIPAWFLGKSIPIVGAPIFAIVEGMVLSFTRRPAILEAGIGFSGKKLLQYSIVFLGFGLDLGVVAVVGLQSLAVMAFTLAAAFITAYFLGKALRIDPKVKMLIGVGTAICGGSAIAATAPVIDASEEEVAYSISTIFLFNIIAVFIFPALGHIMGMGQDAFGLWAGTAINDTSSVVAAAFSYGDQAGRYATIVKLTRTLMIIPVTFAIAISTKRRSTNGGNYQLVRIVPWFVLGFLIASLLRTLNVLPGVLVSLLPELGKFGICAAMAAIGLRSNPIKLIRNGARPILLGLGCWFAVASVSLIVQSWRI
jgi:Predicted membrane protein